MGTTSTEPSPSRTRRHTTAQKAVLALNIVVVIACLTGAVALVWGKDQLDGRLQTDKVPAQTTVTVPPAESTTEVTSQDGSTTASANTFPPADPQAQNFLITGSDANACVDPSSPWAGAADPARANIGSRSDTIMVIRVDPATRQAAVLSFPHDDLWVKIPGRSKNRINSAYVQNDYSLLAQTLFKNFGITVDHYIQVDFCAFKRIVDGVGGVAVPFNTRIVDRNVGLDVGPAPGQTAPFCHTFVGDEALAYVRSRHLRWVDAKGETFEDRAADFGRVSRQQDFLRRVLQTALNKGLFDPTVARALIESLQKDIVTEAGFTINDMLKFAGVMRDVPPDSIRTYQVDSAATIVGGTSVRLPDMGANMKAILAIFQGKAPLVGAPEQVFTTTTTTIKKTNGSTTTGASTTEATTTTTIPGGPIENGTGDILPPKDVKC